MHLNPGMMNAKTEEQRLQEAQERRAKKEKVRAQRELAFILENPDSDEDLQSAVDRARKAGVDVDWMLNR